MERHALMPTNQVDCGGDALWKDRLMVSGIVIAFLVLTPKSTAAFRLLMCRTVAPLDDPSNSQLRLAMNLDVVYACPPPIRGSLRAT